MSGQCPHDEARFCPLYIAAHEGDGLGCDDGELGHGGCAVDRGMDYDAPECALGGWIYVRLQDRFPSVSVECEW